PSSSATSENPYTLQYAAVPSIALSSYPGNRFERTRKPCFPPSVAQKRQGNKTQYSESETPNRRRNLKERLGTRYARTRFGSPEPRHGRSKSPREKGPERRTMFKRLEKGVFHRLGERRRMCSHIQEAQSESHTTVVAGTHKAATKVLALKKQKLLLRNIVTKESIREEWKQCQKVKEVQEGTGSQNQRSKSRVWRTTCPNHGRQNETLGNASLVPYVQFYTSENARAKIAKKGETSGKDKPLAILMVQPWQRIARQRITQTFSPESVISFSTLAEEDRMEGPMIIKADMEGHCVHRIYMDGGSSSQILYKHCFSKFRLEIKNQLILANTPLEQHSDFFHITLPIQKERTMEGIIYKFIEEG
nr:reverse transcriptase domain-containing protein [Tanacetum cinerariifolium]